MGTASWRNELREFKKEGEKKDTISRQGLELMLPDGFCEIAQTVTDFARIWKKRGVQLLKN